MSMINRAKEDKIAKSDIREWLHYNSQTGVFTWLKGRNKGKIAGGVDTRGYYRIKFIGLGDIKAHRLAWFMSYGVFPHAIIDHENQVKHDNRLKNLRCVTYRENSLNVKKRKGTCGKS